MTAEQRARDLWAGAQQSNGRALLSIEEIAIAIKESASAIRAADTATVRGYEAARWLLCTLEGMKVLADVVVAGTGLDTPEGMRAFKSSMKEAGTHAEEVIADARAAGIGD